MGFKIDFKKKSIGAFLLAFFLISCKSPKNDSLFLQLPSSQSGIHFKNTIDEKKFPKATMNEFGYMGAGVAIGDFDNDGLKDIFFCGNQVSCALYHNNGNNSFTDITKSAGVTTEIWATGATVVDINHDGFQDIYVCTYSDAFGKSGHNLLFINQHDNTFKEESKEYGLDISSYCTQAVFFDYDNDNDLDVYLVNYAFNMRSAANNIVPKDLSGKSVANDMLFRNDGDSSGHPFFRNVTKQAGIVDDGYGLGVSVSDFNGDGWPDIYVSNDFLSNDALWINNKNGTFSNTLAASTGHQSYSSMGCDAADINNDGLIDFATVDMMPEGNYRKKLTDFTISYDRYQAERNMNYTPGFTRNMLQLNVGNIQKKDTAIPIFSEIGQMAGISETDWSWSILFADFNNDGNKDVHITNGIGRNFVNADFSQFSKSFGSSIQDPMERREGLNKKLVSLDYVALPNYFYLNNGDYTFTDQSKKAGIDELSISNGAAYVDLDNDGDLDLVVNNINKEPFIFINNTVRPNEKPIVHSIGFILKGDAPNNQGIGTKVEIYIGGKKQLQEEQPVRGYMSSVDTKLIFGTGKSQLVDSMVIVWPNNKRQTLQKLKVDSTYQLYQKNSTAYLPLVNNLPKKMFEDVTQALNVNYKHVDVPFYDYAEQPLLPQKFSQLGPFIATGDIDNNGTTDFFIGGGFNSYGQIFSQNINGTFNGKPLYTGIKFREDMNCVFFDADKDGDEDLLVTYGDMRYDDTSAFYNPQLFINDGKGNFKLSENAIPSSVKTIAGCVTVGDYDGDGDLDIFIGGRVSKKYPNSPSSFILQNNHGIFTDVTAEVCKPLQKGGMITGATWVDFDNDKKLDLVVVGEWMPIRFFKNVGAKLVEVTENTNLKNVNGMWRSLVAADIDNDGDMDFVAGNIGLNCKYHVTANEPMKLFAKDVDNNGKIDPVLFYYMKDEKGVKKLFPSIGRDQLAEQVPSIKKQFLKHADFGYATMEDIFKSKDNMLEFTCDETASCWFENVGNGKFVKHVLPQEAQFAPVNAIICDDLDGDGIKDLLVAGNEYQTEVATGRYDASYGLFLKGNKKKIFQAQNPTATGFIVNGDVKDMQLIKDKNNFLVLVGINNQSAKIFQIKH